MVGRKSTYDTGKGEEEMTSGNKNAKMKRRTAEIHLEMLMKNVKKYNANAFMPYMFSDIVVFGSFVNNPERPMLSDLDIGFKLVKRYDGEAFDAAYKIGMETAMTEMDCLTRYPDHQYDQEDEHNICDEYALKFIKHGSVYISLHRIGDDPNEGENPYIFSKKIQRMDVGEVARLPDEEMIAYGEEEDYDD